MSMNYTTLVGAKTVTGSILSYVKYNKVPPIVVLEEAEAFIYSRLRVREMQASALVTLSQYAFTAGLPTGYLEAIAMRDREGIDMIPDRHVEPRGLLRRRVFDNDVVTTLDGAINSAVTSLVVDSAAEFPASGNYTIQIDSEVMLVTGGQGTTTWTVTRGYGGTTAASHSDEASIDGSLTSGMPMAVAVFDELFQFDCKADTARRYDLAHYKRPTALSGSNETNFLTTRYPNILRVGCLAGAASFMKDGEELKVNLAQLTGLCDAANAESDLGKAA